MTLVYLDVETSGLDPRQHQVWEIAYATDDGPVQASFVEHNLTNADVTALKVGHYVDRLDPDEKGYEFEVALRIALTGATLVGANPAFDTAFLMARPGWKAGRPPWKYRLLDIEAYAMPAFGLAEPKGLAYIAEQLDIVPGDHSAAGDVRCLRECHLALKAFYADALGLG